MQSASLPPDEPARLRALESYDVLDTEPEQAFDEVARLAARICAAPISLVSLVDESRQWFKSCWGLDARETPRSVALSAHAILSCEQVMVVEDARQDERFRDNPLVTGAPHIRFYAGAPLVAPAGHVLGTLCVIDTEPRGLDDLQRTSLQVLASQVVVQLELRKKVRELDAARNVAEQADTAKSMFLANMSHEIRTPLNAILGVAELLHETPLSSQQAQYVSLFRSSGQRLLDLINDILDLSKIEAGKVELAESRFALRPSLESVAEALAVSAARKWIDLVLDVEPDVPDGVLGDEPRLRQVLVNLIGNAIKFTEEGHVVLRVARDTERADHLFFEVNDTGIGISAEDLPRLFEPFAQAPVANRGLPGGTGLGLSLSRQLVERMGGELGARSTVGAGSSFSFSLPLARETERAPEQHATIAGRVLLVADSGPERQALRHALERLGCRVHEAEGGARGASLWTAALATDTPFDAVLIDLRMRPPTGEQVADRMRRHPEALARAVMLLPPDFRLGDVDRSEALGLAGCLVKPVRSKHLERGLADVLAGKRFSFQTETRDTELPAAAGASSRPLRILLAEDAADNRFIVQSFLRDERFRVECAADGLEVVQAFQAKRYDLVLMDMQLPGCDGYRATELIRDWERERGRARTPILALTAAAMDEDRRRALAAGCDAHLAKPIRKQALLEAVGVHVQVETAGTSPSSAAPGDLPAEPSSLDAIAAVRPGFVRGRRKDLAALLAAGEQDDFEAMRRIGHDLCDSGERSDCPEIAEIGATIESAVELEDILVLADAIERLHALLDRVEQDA